MRLDRPPFSLEHEPAVSDDPTATLIGAVERLQRETDRRQLGRAPSLVLGEQLPPQGPRRAREPGEQSTGLLGIRIASRRLGWSAYGDQGEGAMSVYPVRSADRVCGG